MSNIELIKVNQKISHSMKSVFGDDGFLVKLNAIKDEVAYLSLNPDIHVYDDGKTSNPNVSKFSMIGVHSQEAALELKIGQSNFQTREVNGSKYSFTLLGINLEDVDGFRFPTCEIQIEKCDLT